MAEDFDMKYKLWCYLRRSKISSAVVSAAELQMKEYKQVIEWWEIAAKESKALWIKISEFCLDEWR